MKLVRSLPEMAAATSIKSRFLKSTRMLSGTDLVFSVAADSARNRELVIGLSPVVVLGDLVAYLLWIIWLLLGWLDDSWLTTSGNFECFEF
ncbi:hypothetical protein D3C75_601280 [compost metagenome]